jgi:hypothetical protein
VERTARVTPRIDASRERGEGAAVLEASVMKVER